MNDMIVPNPQTAHPDDVLEALAGQLAVLTPQLRKAVGEWIALRRNEPLLRPAHLAHSG